MNHSQLQQTEDKTATFKRPKIAVEISATGMITSAGSNVIETAAAVRAGVSCYHESEHFNKSYNPMVMSLLPDDMLSPLSKKLSKQTSLSSRQRRMLQLATPAIEQTISNLTLKKPIPLMLAGPEKLPGRRSVINDQFLKWLQIQTDAPIDLATSYVFPFGRSAGFYALEAAMLLLEEGTHPYVMVGAVDTYLDLYLLGDLDMQDRIHAAGVMDSFVPGEAACFLILKKADTSTKIKILAPGISEEAGHLYSNQPYTGNGLSEAVQEALAPISNNTIKTVIASFNGENFASKEWGVTLIRNTPSFVDNINLIHPAECIGDVGAAYGTLSLALAATGMANGYLESPALIFGSSEMAQRAAVCITC